MRVFQSWCPLLSPLPLPLSPPALRAVCQPLSQALPRATRLMWRNAEVCHCPTMWCSTQPALSCVTTSPLATTMGNKRRRHSLPFFSLCSVCLLLLLVPTPTHRSNTCLPLTLRHAMIIATTMTSLLLPTPTPTPQQRLLTQQDPPPFRPCLPALLPGNVSIRLFSPCLTRLLWWTDNLCNGAHSPD